MDDQKLSNGKIFLDSVGQSQAGWAHQGFEVIPGKLPKTWRCMCLMPPHAKKGILNTDQQAYFIRCEQVYNDSSSSDVWVKHLVSVHGLQIPARLTAKPSTRDSQQHSILKFAKIAGEYDCAGSKRPRDCQQIRSDAVVLAHCFNPLIPFEAADNPYFRVAYADAAFKDSGIGSSNCLKKAVLAFYERLLIEQKRTVKGICGFQMDAGKDVKSRKLHAACYMHPSIRRSIVYKLTDTNDAELDEAWHHVYITDAINSFMAGGKTFVPSLTVDNEASQNAGIATAVVTTLPWLIHFRCGNHSIELLLKYLRQGLPCDICDEPANIANELVSAIRNHKATLKALRELQAAAGQAPLVLVKSCNTRKWSADYLVCQRLLKLQVFVMSMYTNPQLAQHLPAQQIYWHRLQSFVTMSFPFYFAEQVLQRDSSNAIHYAHFWKITRDHALSICSTELVRPGLTQEQVSRIRACKIKIENRDNKVMECGVFKLCDMLWPDPERVSTATWNEIVGELRWFVEKQWDKWMELKAVVEFPDEELNVDNPDKRDFIRLCVLELSHHRSGELELIQSSRAAFLRSIDNVRADYESAQVYARPKMAKSPLWSSSLHAYWSTLRYSCPHIYFIYHILSHCCATEAGTERMFSSEKMIHSSIRNQLHPELTRAIMTIRWNFESLRLFGGSMVQHDEGSENEIEFIDYD